MWAVRTVSALKRWQPKPNMNNDRGDRTLDVREMTELARTTEIDQPDKRLLEREYLILERPHNRKVQDEFDISCIICVLFYPCWTACSKLTIFQLEPRYSRPFRPGIDVNLYATKKSVAQGMMDIALLTANASQLKYILREGEESKFYLVNVICIGISIALQIVVGVLLILNTRYNINLVSHQSRAELINNLTIIGIFLITTSNVFVSAFGTSPR